MLLDEYDKQLVSPTNSLSSKSNAGSIESINDELFQSGINLATANELSPEKQRLQQELDNENARWNKKWAKVTKEEAINTIKDIPSVLAQANPNFWAGVNSGFWNSAKFLNDAALNLNAEAWAPESGIPMNADVQQAGVAGKVQSFINKSVQDVDAIQRGIKDTYPTKSVTGEAVGDAFTSMGQMGATLPLYAVSPWLALGAFGLPTAQEHYESMQKKGFSKAASYGVAIPLGITEGATEMMSFSPLTKLGKVGTAKVMSQFFGRELPGEQVQLQLENLESKGLLKKDGTVGDFVKNLTSYYTSPDALVDAYRVFVSTITMTGVIGGSSHAAHWQTRKNQADSIKGALENYEESIKNNVHVTDPEGFTSTRAQLEKVVAGTSFEPAFLAINKLAEITPEERAAILQAVQEHRDSVAQADQQAVIDQALQGISPNPTEGALNEQGTEQGQVQERPSEAGSQTGSGTDVQGNGIQQTGITEPASNDQQSLPDLSGQRNSVDSGLQLKEFSNWHASTDRSDRVFSTTNVDSSSANVVEDVLQSVGSKTKVVLITRDELQNPTTDLEKDIASSIVAQKPGTDLSSMRAGRTYHAIKLSNGQTVSVAVASQIAGESPVDKHVWLHEAVGHIVQEEFRNSATPEIHQKIKDQFQEFRTKIEKGGITDALVQEFVDTGLYKWVEKSELAKLLQSYVTQGAWDRIEREWEAHNIVKALMSTKPAQTAVEKWWKSYAELFKKLYNSFKAANLDLVTGVSSIREFVAMLQSNQESVENFNIKLDSPEKRTVHAILKSMVEVDNNGKLIIKPQWLVRNMIDGKLTLAVRKFLKRYASKDGQGGWKQDHVRQPDAAGSIYGVVKNADNSWSIVVREKVNVVDEEGRPTIYNGMVKKRNETTEVLWTIEPHQFPTMKGVSKSNVAYYLVSNIRDALIIGHSMEIRLKDKPTFIEGFLQTAKGKAVKVKIPDANAKLLNIYQQAVIRGAELNIPSAQMFLDLMAGKHSAFSGHVLGIKGTPTSKASEQRTAFKVQRDIKKFQDLFPNLFEALYSVAMQNQTAEVAPSEKLLEDKIEEEIIEEPTLPVVEVSGPLKKLEAEVTEKIEELIEKNRPKKKGVAIDGLKVFNNYKDFYLNDYADAMDKSYAEAFAKAEIERLLEQELSVKLQNHAKIADMQKEIREINKIAGTMYLGEDDLRVYHGTSKINKDVPTMDHADPDALYGPGIYTTEDHIDPVTGHAIVSAGYAGDIENAKFTLAGKTHPEITDSALAFEIDLNHIVQNGEHTYEQEEIAKDILHLLHADKYVGYNGKVEELIGEFSDSIELLGLDINKYGKLGAPNILPMEIDPDPKRVFVIDKFYSPEEVTRITGTKYTVPQTGEQIYSDILLAEGMTKTEANNHLMSKGFDWINHEGGAISKGVSHRVWIALKDGLVKSQFDPTLQNREDDFLAGDIGLTTLLNSVPTSDLPLYKNIGRDLVDGKQRYEMDTASIFINVDGINKLRDIANGVSKQRGTSIYNVLKLDWLYKAYPELKRIQVVPVTFTDGTRATFDSENKEIRIDTKYLAYNLRSMLTESLAHEVQHFIQNKEGFAEGSSDTWWRRHIAPFRLAARKAMLGYNAAWEVWNVARLYNTVDEFKAAINAGTHNDIRTNWRIDGAIRETANLWIDPNEVSNFLSFMGNQLSDAVNEYAQFPRNAFIAYLKTAGEQEARRVASRIFLTMLQKEQVADEDPKFIKRYDTFYVVNNAVVKYADQIIEDALDIDLTKLDQNSTGWAQTIQKSGKVNVRGTQQAYGINHVPNHISDDLAIELTNRIYSDDFAARRTKVPQDQTTGPYAFQLKKIVKVRQAKRSKPDPIKTQERRDKLNAFILNMNTLLQEARRQKISLSEYLKTNAMYTNNTYANWLVTNAKKKNPEPVPTDKLGIQRVILRQIAKDIQKFHANTSRFSQAEIIMRLASELGLVNENGKTGLEFVVQTLFPPIEGEKTNPDGTIQYDVSGKSMKKMYKGASGEVSQLGTAAKEHLIHALQTMMVRKTGVEMSVEEQETMAQRKNLLLEEESNRPVWKRVVGLLQWIENDWRTRLSTTAAGKELLYRVQNYLWKTIDYQRDWLLKLNEIGKKYETVDQRKYLYDLLQGIEVPKNQMESNCVELIKTINHTYAQEMELNQVKTYYKNGSWEYFKYDPASADVYFPHIFEPGSFEKPTDRMIQSLIDSHEAIDRAQALVLIKKFKQNYIRSQRYANMEYARETNLEGWIEDPIKVYHKYVTSASRRLAQLYEFGATPELALTQFALKHFKEGRDSEGLTNARDFINQVLGNRVEENLMRDPAFGMTYGIALSTGLMLQHAAFVQPGTAMNMAAVGGFKNLVKGISAVLMNKQVSVDSFGNPILAREWAKLSGVLAFTMNKELYDIVLDEKVRSRTDKVLRSFGVTQIDSMMRIIGAMTGKLYGMETAMKYARKQDARGYERLRRLGLNPDSILNRANPGILEPEELRRVALAFTEETNFVTNPMSTPVMLKGHPLGRIFFLFSRFVFQQHHLWKTILNSSKGGGASQGLKAVLAGFTVGTPMMLLKMYLTGDDPEKMLEKDGIAKMLWKAFTTGGGPGLFIEALGNAIFQAAGKQTGAGTAGMAIDSPALGLLDTMFQGIKATSKLAFTDEGTDADTHKVLKAAMMALQAATMALPDKVGIPMNATLGMARPLVEKGLYPSKRQKETSWLQN